MIFLLNIFETGCSLDVRYFKIGIVNESNHRLDIYRLLIDFTGWANKAYSRT